MGALTEKLLTYAMGRGAAYYDMPTVRAIVRDARKTNYRSRRSCLESSTARRSRCA